MMNVNANVMRQITSSVVNGRKGNHDTIEDFLVQMARAATHGRYATTWCGNMPEALFKWLSDNSFKIRNISEDNFFEYYEISWRN